MELLPPTELCPIAAKGKHISGIVSAFGLGGCNAVAVFEVKRDDAPAAGKAQTAKSLSLQTDGWVQAENTYSKMRPACYVGQISFVSENGASLLQIRLLRDASGVRALSYIPQKGMESRMVLQYRRGNEPGSALQNGKLFAAGPASRLVVVSEVVSFKAWLPQYMAVMPLLSYSFASKVQTQVASMLVYDPPHPADVFHSALDEMAMPIMQPQTIYRNGKRFVPEVLSLKSKIKQGINAPPMNVVTLISSPIANEVKDAISSRSTSSWYNYRGLIMHGTVTKTLTHRNHWRC